MDKVEDIILVHVLQSEGSYDPVKAHEYYLRTRKLKGRKLGSRVVTSSRSSSAQLPSRTARRTVTPVVNLRVRAITRQMLILQGALAELRKHLKELIEKEKKTASSSKKTRSTSTSEEKKKQEDRKPLTPTEKAEAAKLAKKSYEKNKKLQVQTREEIRAKIKEIEIKLLKLKADLKKIREQKNKGPDKAGRKSGDPNLGTTDRPTPRGTK